MIASGRMDMHDQEDLYPRRLTVLEGLVLLLAAPFLAFPETFPIVTYVALIALGVTWVLAHLSAGRVATPFDITIALWCVALIIGILVTADPGETLPKATNLVLGLGIWRFLVIAVRTRRTLYLAVGCFLLLCLGFSLIGLAGAEELPKIPALAKINPFGDDFLPGFLGKLNVHPNQVAGLLSLFWPLLVSLSFSPPPGFRSWPWRALSIGMTLLAMVIMILTQSRGGWVAAAAGLFGLVIMWGTILPRSGSRRALRLVAGGWLLAGLLALAWLGPTRMQEMWLDPPQKTAVGTLLTLNYRKELWPWAITAVQDFPYTGVGLGAFREVAFRLYPLALSPDRDIGHAHNIFLQTALDVGLPGLTVYLALLFVAGAVGWQAAYREVDFRSISLGLLAGLLAVHVFGLADALALGSRPSAAFWFSMALLAAMNNIISRQDRRG